MHRDDDPDLGTPLCPDCYDYQGQVAFNWYAPELWRRFTITLRRRLAEQLGYPAPNSRSSWSCPSPKSPSSNAAASSTSTPSSASTAPATATRPRRPGHRRPADATPSTPQPPPSKLTPSPYDPAGRSGSCGSAPSSTSAPSTATRQREASTGPMHPRDGRCLHRQIRHQSRRDFGLTPHRIHPLTDLDRAARHATTSAGCSRHRASRSARRAADDTAARRAGRPLTRWLHMLGFRGHFATKSRRYSTTLGRLRAERRTWRRRHDPNRWPDRHRRRPGRDTWSSSGSGPSTAPAGSPTVTPPSPPPPPPAPANTASWPAARPTKITNSEKGALMTDQHPPRRHRPVGSGPHKTSPTT